jgi:ADP-heptose:LPS heptosyltransferase
MLCVVPLLRALRGAHPQARIVLLASPVNAAVMESNRWLDDVILFDKRRYLEGATLRTGAIRELFASLRNPGFDLVLTPATVSMSGTSDLLAMATRAPVRIGPGSLEGRRNPSAAAYTHPVPLDWSGQPHRHQTLRNLDIAAALRLPDVPLHSEITLKQNEVDGAKSFLSKHFQDSGSFIVYHPGAGKPPNRWPADRFARLAREVAAETRLGILVTSGSFDREPVGAMAEGLGRAFTLVENRPIREVAAILAMARLVVSNDTGIMHVAAAVGTPVLSLFGPTDPRQWAPLSAGSRYIQGEGGDIRSIALDDVRSAVLSMLSAQALHRPLSDNNVA